MADVLTDKLFKMDIEFNIPPLNRRHCAFRKMQVQISRANKQSMWFTDSPPAEKGNNDLLCESDLEVTMGTNVMQPA